MGLLCCVTVRCSVLQWLGWMNFLQKWQDVCICIPTQHVGSTVLCYSALQCGAVRCSALQCIAVRCSALQCVAVRCNDGAEWEYSFTNKMCVFVYLLNWLVCYAVLQCVAVCCSDWAEWVYSLRWGWVFLERTRILSGIQFTTHFIDVFVVETNRFVGSFVHVILTRQTCGQRSSRVAESKRRALGNYFSERICYVFLISKCGGDRDLGLCTTSVLTFGEPQRNGKIRLFLHWNRIFFRKSPLRYGSPNASTEVVHRPRSRSPLHFDTRNT